MGPAPAPPRPGSRHRPFPGPFPAPQPRAPRRPLAPAVTRHRTVGRPRAVTAPIGRWEVRLRSTGAAWTGALGGLGQVPWEAPRGKPRQTPDLSLVYVRQASLCSASALGGTDLHLPAPWGSGQTDRFRKVLQRTKVSWGGRQSALQRSVMNFKRDGCCRSAEKAGLSQMLFREEEKTGLLEPRLALDLRCNRG